MCTGLILINNIGNDGEVMPSHLAIIDHNGEVMPSQLAIIDHDGEVMPSQLTIIDHDGDGDALMVLTMEGKVSKV